MRLYCYELDAIQVKLCNGKLLTIIAGKKGFYNVGKQLVRSSNLVNLLQKLSKAFSNVSSPIKNDDKTQCVLSVQLFFWFLSIQLSHTKRKCFINASGICRSHEGIHRKK